MFGINTTTRIDKQIVKEITFLKQNADKWQEFEKLISTKGGSNPDLMADLFIQLTDDLSYSKTHYPKTKTTQYLNSIAARVHQEIYKNKKQKERADRATVAREEQPKIEFISILAR